MKRMLTALAAVISAVVACADAVDGVWTTRGYQGTAADWTTGSNWQDSNVPQAAGDTATMKTSFNQANAGYSWGTTMRIHLPEAAGVLFAIDGLSGYYHFDLKCGDRKASSDWKDNQYSFGDMTDYKGQVTLSGNTTLKVPALAADATNVVHNLNANKSSTLAVEEGVTKLGKLSGVGTLNKTGAGELAFEGVSAAMGVTVAVKEGRLTLGGHPAVADTAPVSGAALWIDASKTDSMTFDASSKVSAIADARGGDYPVATQYRGENARLVDFADKKLLNCGAFYNNSAYDPTEQAKYGNASSFHIPSEIADVQSFFVVYRYNKEVGGTDVFPIGDKGGYVLRPGTTSDNKIDSGSYADGTGTPLFRYVQYGTAYQCYAPHKLVSGDLRRDGEAIPYDTAPRGYGENLDLISATVSDGGFYPSGALPNVGFQTLAGNHDVGHLGGSQIAEVIAYTNRLSEAEQRRNIAYLNAKWMKHVGVYDWDLGVLTPAGGEVYVPEGQVAYVKNLDLRSAPLVKTGPGKLAVRYVKGYNKVRVEDGEFAILPPLLPDVETPDPVPAYGKAAHLDASAAGAFTFVQGSETAITAWNSAESGLSYAAGTTSSAGTAGDGNPTVTTDARGMKWVDFGTASWMYFKKGAADSSGPLDSNSFNEFFAVVKKSAGSTRNPNVFGTYSPYNRFCPAGDKTLLAANPYGNPASDGNGAYYQTYATAQWALNGKWVDPRADGCTDDEVSVIRVSAADQTYFNAIGCSYTSGKGGCLVGEIICYDRRLTDRERVATERYLLKKWKGEDAEHPDFLPNDDVAIPSVEYATGATTTFDTASDVTVGDFKTPATVLEKEGVGELSIGVLPVGITTLSVAGGSFSAAACAPDVAAPTILTDGSAYIHLDASDFANTVWEQDAQGNLRVKSLKDPRDNGMTGERCNDGQGYYVNSPDPILRLCRQNGRNVVDLGEKDSAEGAHLRWALDGVSQKYIKEASALIVYANRDAGKYANPFATFGAGNKTWKNGGDAAIYSSESERHAKEGTLDVDGVNRANDAGPYPDGYHVFYQGNMSGWTQNLSGIGTGDDNKSSAGGMLFCEIFVFPNTLSAAQRTETSGYLMKKWGIGGKSFSAQAFTSISAGKDATVKLGFGVNTATLSGNGTFEAPSVSGVSAITTELSETSVLNVTGALTLADTGTITVTVPAGVKPTAGVYPILTAGTPDASAAEKLANWTAVLPTVKGRTFAIKVVDGQICLDVGKLGLMVIVQ